MSPLIALSQSATKSSPRLRTILIETWHSVRIGLFDPYRPELHYMRGPGPKWRAKHAGVTLSSP